MYIESGVIYADVLFLINFSIDFLCLFIAGRLNKRGGRAWRTVAAAALGGVYSFLPYLISELPVFVSLPLHLGAAAAMTSIAFGFGCGAKRFWLTAVSFAVTEALMGGLITALYGLSSGGSPTEYSAGDGGLRFAVICGVSALAALIYSLLCRSASKAKSCDIRISVGGERIAARLLVDSGNLVTEPFSALPVIVLSSTALPPPYDSPEAGAFPVPIRAIPFTTGAGSGCLYGFRPEKIEVVAPAKRTRRVEAYIGVDTHTASYSGYDGLMPAELA